jgi:glucose/arabinose dehydrogenase
MFRSPTAPLRSTVRSARRVLGALGAAVVVVAAAACGHKQQAAAPAGCDDSIKLPPGFCATVFAESVGPARHLVVRRNGDVYLGVLDQRRQPGGVVALRDTNHDGQADVRVQFGDTGVHGVVLAGDSTLYVSTASAVFRYRITDSLAPKRKPDTVIVGLATRPLPSHSLAIDRRGDLVVNVGAASDACAPGTAPQTPGTDPCPELDSAGGIWTFAVDRNKQTIKDGTRVATGLHNAIALAVSPFDTTIYAVSHGRDGLHDRWPTQYTDEASAVAASEEMIRIATSRADFGWPYCYYDFLKEQRVVAPEYAGSKTAATRCDRLIQPLIAFPAHWAPMSILFYSGKMFPPQYRGGAFIAFHGSAYRAPLPEDGYEIVFLEFKQGLAADYTVFANGFAGTMMNPQGAAHRAVGLAQGPDGSLYVSDDKGGRIWRVTYKAPK